MAASAARRGLRVVGAAAPVRPVRRPRCRRRARRRRRRGGDTGSVARDPPRDLGRRPACGDRPDHAIAASRDAPARAARRPRPRDGLHGHPDRPRPGPPRRGAGRLRRPRHLRPRPQHRPAAGVRPSPVRGDRAALGARRGPGHDRQPAVRGGHAAVVRRAVAGDRDELLVAPPAAGRGRAAPLPFRARPGAGRPGRALPRRPRPGSRHRAADRRAAAARGGRPPVPAGLRPAPGRSSRPPPAGRSTRVASTSCRRFRPTSSSTGSVPRTSSRCRSSPRR